VTPSSDKEIGILGKDSSSRRAEAAARRDAMMMSDILSLLLLVNAAVVVRARAGLTACQARVVPREMCGGWSLIGRFSPDRSPIKKNGHRKRRRGESLP